MKVMGIDASTTATGYSIFDNGELVAFGCIKPKGDWRERIMDESKTLKQIIEQYMPIKIYMEDVPLKGGNSTLMKLGAVQGCVLGVAASYGVEIEFLLPATWRSPLGLFDGTRAGTHRDVLKEKAIQMANKEFGLKLVWNGPKSKKTEDDVAEAILIAYSQIKKRRISRKSR